MRIAINCRSILLSQYTGIGRYTYHLLESLGQIDQANEYILHACHRLFNSKRRLPDFSRYRNLKRYNDYFNWGVGRCDVYHYPCPDLVRPRREKLAVTVHDLVYKIFPEGHTSKTIELTEKYMGSIAAHADKIICISQNTRRDLHRLLDIPSEKSCVVYNGVDHDLFYPLGQPQRREAEQHLKAMGIARPYMLYVGTIEPRKNLKGLLESLACLKSKKVFQGQLVVAGMKGWMVDNIAEYIKQLGIEEDVVFTGFINDEQLRALYNLAELFVFPSFYEGFGFPILEAFSCGAPVIASKTSSCAEVAGQAAMLVDPYDAKGMADAMEEVLTDKPKAEALRRAGLQRARDFSFNQTARQTLSVYQQLAH